MKKTIQIKGLIPEDFVNYKLPSMVVMFPYCSFKCEKESGVGCCQNSPLATSPTKMININDLIELYRQSSLAAALVCGGLEPFDSWEELQSLVTFFRKNFNDDIVIYTGYKEEELLDKINWLKTFNNIFVKFGRFIPNSKSKYDEILGITLASDNQYAKKLEV